MTDMVPGSMLESVAAVGFLNAKQVAEMTKMNLNPQDETDRRTYQEITASKGLPKRSYPDTGRGFDHTKATKVVDGVKI